MRILFVRVTCAHIDMQFQTSKNYVLRYILRTKIPRFLQEYCKYRGRDAFPVETGKELCGERFYILNPKGIPDGSYPNSNPESD